jgi:antitoxin component of MazEF toxin-antitoxin module
LKYNLSQKISLVVILLALARVRKVGGSLVVTIPREVAEEEGVKPGELVNVEIRKTRKSFFGAARGIGPFTRDDEMTDHD